MTATNNTTAQTTEASTNAKPDKVSRLIGLLAVLTPAFYLVGTSFYDGWLAAAGVSKDSFPISTQETYVNGFLGFGMIIWEVAKVAMEFISSLLSLSTVGVLSFCVILIYLFNKFKNTLKTSTIILTIKTKFKEICHYFHQDNNHFSKAISITAVVSYVVAFVSYLPIYVLLLWLGLPLASYYLGQNLSAKEITEYRAHGCQFHEKTGWSNCHTLKSKDGKVIQEGYIVAQNNVRVAFLTEDGTNIRTIPKDAVLNRQWQVIKSTKAENDQSTSSKDKKDE